MLRITVRHRPLRIGAQLDLRAEVIFSLESQNTNDQESLARGVALS